MVHISKYDMYAHLEGSWGGGGSRSSEATFVYHVLSIAVEGMFLLLGKCVID